MKNEQPRPGALQNDGGPTIGAEERKREKQKSERLNVWIAIGSAVFALLAALAAFWAAYEAHLTRIADERPFIFVNPFPDEKATSHEDGPGIDPNHPYIFSTGKTPALEITVICERMRNIGVIETYKGLVQHVRQGDVGDFPYLLPGHSLRVVCGDYPPLPHDANAPAPQEGRVYDTIGVVEYKDAAHRRYRTPFCFKTIEVGDSNDTTFNEAPCTGYKDYNLPDLE